MRAASSGKAAQVLVLGAGIVGVSTAYYLAKRGLAVQVIDAMPGPGLDTSFANGAQISVCHADPWANPSAPLKVLKWLGREDSPLLFRPRLDPWQWWWLLGWSLECLPQRTRRNTIDILKLATLSRSKVQEIRREERLEYDASTLGILHFFRSQAAFDQAMPVAEMMRQYGCDRQILSVDRMVEIEPTLGPLAENLVGGTYSADDESGDAYKFTLGLAQRCAEMGVRFEYQKQIVALRQSGGRVSHVEIRDLDTGQYEERMAEHYVVALGAFSAPLLRPLGIRLNIYPAKGYSLTIPIEGSNAAPSVSLTDDSYKTVFTRIGDRLRVAGTAELNGYGRELNPVRVQAMLSLTQRNFPMAGNFEKASVWSGLRPATPSNLPYLGRSALDNLSLNTGHGTLGWTMGPGSAFLLAEAIAAGNKGSRLLV